jgi:AraC-like DNA-binding protein
VPLSQFPAVRTRDVAEFRQRISGLFSVWSVDMDRDTRGFFEGVLNYKELDSVGLTYARYGSVLAASLSAVDYFTQGFPLNGAGSFVVNRSEGLISHHSGIACEPGSEIRLKYTSDFEHLIIKIKPEALTRKLSALLGRPVDPQLRMSRAPATNPEAKEAQFRLIDFVVKEIDRDANGIPPLVLAEFEQSLIMSYLSYNQHNYSPHLQGGAPGVAPWQVRRAEEYIEQHWDQPLTVEALALVANVSLRSLFDSFRKSRGMSPMAFVRQVRLRRANGLLARPSADTNVTSVAYTCGFSNLGHFAKYYYSAYGEHPSVTLKTALMRRKCA